MKWGWSNLEFAGAIFKRIFQDIDYKILSHGGGLWPLAINICSNEQCCAVRLMNGFIDIEESLDPEDGMIVTNMEEYYFYDPYAFQKSYDEITRIMRKCGCAKV